MHLVVHAELLRATARLRGTLGRQHEDTADQEADTEEDANDPEEDDPEDRAGREARPIRRVLWGGAMDALVGLRGLRAGLRICVSLAPGVLARAKARRRMARFGIGGREGREGSGVARERLP